MSRTARIARTDAMGFARRLMQASMACPNASAPHAAVSRGGLPTARSESTSATFGRIAGLEKDAFSGTSGAEPTPS